MYSYIRIHYSCFTEFIEFYQCICRRHVENFTKIDSFFHSGDSYFVILSIYMLQCDHLTVVTSDNDDDGDARIKANFKLHL